VAERKCFESIRSLEPGVRIPPSLRYRFLMIKIFEK
jgi:hypothetical protein